MYVKILEIIEREEMEMIELMDPAFDVRAYFSHPPLDEQLGSMANSWY